MCILFVLFAFKLTYLPEESSFPNTWNAQEFSHLNVLHWIKLNYSHTLQTLNAFCILWNRRGNMEKKLGAGASIVSFMSPPSLFLLHFFLMTKHFGESQIRFFNDTINSCFIHVCNSNNLFPSIFRYDNHQLCYTPSKNWTYTLSNKDQTSVKHWIVKVDSATKISVIHYEKTTKISLIDIFLQIFLSPQLFLSI